MTQGVDLMFFRFRIIGKVISKLSQGFSLSCRISFLTNSREQHAHGRVRSSVNWSKGRQGSRWRRNTRKWRRRWGSGGCRKCSKADKFSTSLFLVESILSLLSDHFIQLGVSLFFVLTRKMRGVKGWWWMMMKTQNDEFIISSQRRALCALARFNWDSRDFIVQTNKSFKNNNSDINESYYGSHYCFKRTVYK